MVCVPRKTRFDILFLFERRTLMLNKNDNETLQEIMMAFHAKNKLEEITKFLKGYKDNSLLTKEILELIEKDNKKNDYF